MDSLLTSLILEPSYFGFGEEIQFCYSGHIGVRHSSIKFNIPSSAIEYFINILSKQSQPVLLKTASIIFFKESALHTCIVLHLAHLKIRCLCFAKSFIQKGLIFFRLYESFKHHT